jgi:DNA integrity scanning protein DisA with diadenylate cyclase activity
MEKFPAPYELLVLKLEEELNTLRQVLQFLQPGKLTREDIQRFLTKTGNLITLTSDILNLKLEWEGEENLEQELGSTIFETLFLSKTILEKLEPQLPVFYESITVYEEPFLAKLEQILNTLEQYTTLVEEETKKPKLDVEELAYLMKEISQALNYLSLTVKKITEREL